MKMTPRDDLLRALRKLPTDLDLHAEPQLTGLPHVEVVASGLRFRVSASRLDGLVLVLSYVLPDGTTPTCGGHPTPYPVAPFGPRGELALVEIGAVYSSLHSWGTDWNEDVDDLDDVEPLWLESIELKEDAAQ